MVAPGRGIRLWGRGGSERIQAPADFSDADAAAKADWDAFMARQNENNALLITLRDKATAKDASAFRTCRSS